MAIVSTGTWLSQNKHKKRTTQGCGRGTKFGSKHSKNKYVKKYRGQGGRKR